ncbi:MAG: hypothetical protein HN390_13215 [Anaerolineae bacterium]|jgi:hypothetical protein|nr:hypothetical protein [Anaerolineae bacterium]MBT7188791.1 hypothetical protein [Anaerolineae bacterium]MBT7991559.1 hypothetical protein [Anaerolineae bacterium]
MDHQHIEKKLLNDEQLTPEENRALRNHLPNCPICSALVEANLALKHVTMAAPAPGFANRFTTRLAGQRKAQKRRYFFGGLILFLSGAGALLWLASPLLTAALSSPADILTTWVSFIVATLSFIQTFSEAGKVVFRVATGFISPTTWAFALSLLSILGMFILSFSQKLLVQRQPV